MSEDFQQEARRLLASSLKDADQCANNGASFSSDFRRLAIAPLMFTALLGYLATLCPVGINFAVCLLAVGLGLMAKDMLKEAADTHARWLVLRQACLDQADRIRRDFEIL